MKEPRRVSRRIIALSTGCVVLVTAGLLLFQAFSAQRSSAVVPKAAPPVGAASTKVGVPASMRTDTFATDRFLTIPAGFKIDVYARVGGARFMTMTPNGDLLVSVPSMGKVVRVQPNQGGDPTISDVVTGLRKPHDMVFHTINGTTYLYIAETHEINRYVYSANGTLQNRQIVISGLPDSSTPELKGAYGHELKNIALDGNHKLYVSIASTCNACVEDTVSNPVRGAIYQYNADGSGGRIFARGLRNAEGLAIYPGTNDLWVAVNNRDNIAYPYKDNTGNYGKVIPDYVDNHPPEEFTRVRDGGNYGWPFCNPNPDSASGYNNMPVDQDAQLNADGHVDCTKIDRINKGIQAHSAPLGLTLLHDTKFAAMYRQGGIVALHGSWNRQQPTGYKLAYFPMQASNQVPGEQVDFVSGWIAQNAQKPWGRPVDTAVDGQGNLFISDDYSGTVYKMTQTAAKPAALAAGTYQITVKNSGKALGVANGSTAQQALVQQQNVAQAKSQQWKVEPLADGSYRFTAVHSQKVLDAKQAGTANGTLIWQWNWNNSCAQHWKLMAQADGSYTIGSGCSQKVLDINGRSTANGAQLQLWSANGGSNQAFLFKRIGA